MNRALYYFGGKKALMIPFLVFLGLQMILTLKLVLYIGYGNVLLQFLSELVLLAVMYGMWLRAKKIVLYFGVIISLALYIAYFVCEQRYYEETTGYLLIGLMNLILYVAFIIILIYEKYAMKVAFIVFDVLTFMTPFMTQLLSSNIFYLKVILTDGIYGMIIAGVMTFLWIPLEMFRICPSCGFRNEKTAGFCGGCGSRL